MSTPTVTDSSLSPRSIYAGERPSAAPTRRSRGERRARARARVLGALPGRPPLVLDRAAPMQAALRDLQASERGSERLRARVERVRAEVEALEAWAATLPRPEREGGAAVRRALELLRAFGRLLVLDLSDVPEDDRAALVHWLALENRWCYAAAGTDRAAFKRATGRTGAR